MTDPTARALELLGLLERRPLWTGAELAERLGVAGRTLRRDVDRLRGLGYAVEADAGPGGGYSLGRGQALPPLHLDGEQAAAVTVALARMAQDADAGHAEAALAALATIDRIMPAAARQRLVALREAVVVEPAEGGVPAEVLLPCAEAIERRVRLEFAYTDRHGARTERTVEPVRLAAGSRSWRLLAFDLGRDDWRAFRLDRLAAPRVGTWRFAAREDLPAALARFEEPVPAEVWRHRVEVRLHVAPEELGSIPAELARSIERGADGEAVLVTGADEPDEAARWLAAIPYPMTVLGDDAVREAVARLAERLARASAPAAS